MDVLSYYDAHSPLNPYYSGLVEPSYEACEPPFYPRMGVSSDYEGPPYLSQWADGIDGYAPAYPDAGKELCGTL